jgi:hypothetical protein
MNFPEKTHNVLSTIGAVSLCAYQNGRAAEFHRPPLSEFVTLRGTVNHAISDRHNPKGDALLSYQSELPS